MNALYSADDYQNMVQCYIDSECYLTRACNLFTKIYGLPLSQDTILHAIRTYGGTFGIPGSTSTSDDGTITDENTVSFNATTIKTEVEVSEEVVIKEEPSDIEIKESINQTHLEKRIPIVYTTKLDDMLLFNKDITRLEIDDIVEIIIFESKPKIRNNILIQDKNSLKHVINPFFKLVEKVRQFNELASTNTEQANTNLYLSKRSQKLLEQCKPLYVVLTDIKGKLKGPPIVEINSNSEDEDTLPLSNYRKKQNKVMCLKKSEYACLAFVDMSAEVTEIYYINKRGIEFLCTENGVLWGKLPRNCIIMENCCWVARETSISNIEFLPKLENKLHKATVDLMRKPHRCLPRKCSCCCKKQSTTYENVNVTDLKSQDDSCNFESTECDSSIWLNNLNSLSYHEKETCISKALKSGQSKPANIFRVSKPDSKSQLPSTEEELQILNTWKKLVQSYIVRKQNVHMYIERKMRENDTASRAFGKPFGTSKECCCWSRHNFLLGDLQSRYPCNVLNFIRTPHTCTVNKCKCCCKYLTPPIRKSVNKDCGWPTKFLHAQNYTNQTFLRRKKMKFIVITKKSIETKRAVDSKINLNSKESLPSCPIVLQAPAIAMKTSTQVILPPPLVGITVPVNTTQNNIPPSSNLPFSHSIKPMTPSGKKQQNPIGTQSNIAQTSSTDSENLDPTVNSLVSSILHRFRDVRLTITPDGDVSAELNTPIQSLSTSELKILSGILAHAKEQVKALKLNPGTASTVINMSGISIPGMSGTPITNSIAPHAPSSSSIPGMSGTPITNSIAPHAPSSSSIPGMTTTPIIKSVASLAPSASNISGIPLMNSAISQEYTAIGVTIPVIKSVGSEQSNSSHIPGPSGISNTKMSDPPSMLAAESPKSHSPSATVPKLKDKSLNKQIASCSAPKSSSSVFQCYTNITGIKVQQYIKSCKSFLCNQVNGEKRSIPKIDNVFSLRDEQNIGNHLQPKVGIEKLPVVAGPSGVKRKSQTNKNNLKKSKSDIDQHAISLVAVEQNVSQQVKTAPILNNLLMAPAIPPSNVSNPLEISSINQNPVSITVPMSVDDGIDIPALIPFPKPQVQPDVLPQSVKKDEDSTSKNNDECILGV